MSRRALLIAVAAVLAGDVAAAYQLGVRADRAPSFSRGGAFAVGAAAGAEVERPLPYTPVSAAAPETTSSTTTPPAVDAAPAPPTTVAPVTATAPVERAVGPPAVGRYRYAVEGWEAATGFGRRDLPGEMTMTVSPDPDGDESARVLDVRFSGQHEERAIATHDDATGVAFVYEAGSVTFGPYTRTSEADYEPPMVQVPARLEVGAVASGTTDAGTRVEDWTVSVTGQEVVAGYDTFVVTIERTSRPGGSEEVRRTRTVWFAPALGTWVQVVESMHGGQRMAGASFTYDCEYRATLVEVGR